MQPTNPPRLALVDDDDLSMTRVFNRCLSMWGWEAVECHSIAAALAAFPQGPFALAVCDVDLPDGDGISLAQVLVKRNPSLSVLIVSGLPDNLDRARRGGLAACLRKPLELPELKALIDSPRSGKESLDLA
ncbi:MAG: response regulator [Elusimicrobiota bacterium]|nr:response regulator [Elusimicrobiota bacterium]